MTVLIKSVKITTLPLKVKRLSRLLLKSESVGQICYLKNVLFYFAKK